MKRFTILIIITTLSLLAVNHFVQTSATKTQSPNESEVIDQNYNQSILEYGIPIDSFDVEVYTVKRNQTLGSIMSSHGVSGEHIRQLQLKAKDVFNIRSIKAGNTYKIFSKRDTTASVEYLVYEHSFTDYVIFHFNDSLAVRAEQKEVKPVTRLSEAEISSSLWEAMNDYNLKPVLALDLSEVFAWAVDFFGLYRGDKFKVFYDELFVEDASVGIGTIHAAWFEHRGHKYYAFRFQQDSVWSYWDEQGNSLRKAFLKSPLRFSRITSKFSHSRKHPILKIYRPHTGVDYAAPEGTPVMALGDGIVIEKGYNDAAGNYIKIKHNSVYTTGYNHFSRFGKGVSKGTRVTQGQIIGYVGKTGYATGPHLDLRFWKNGKPVDPLRIEAPSVEPIKEENKDAFSKLVSNYRVKLDSISLRPVFPQHASYSFAH
jgi:murein DD-endopeptidase MepM/ murein hydrolase activator NlpD